MTVATPVDFEAYGDYAPPPGAYEQQGNMATLVYPIDGPRRRRRLDAASAPTRAGTTSTTRTTAPGRSDR